MRFQVEYGQYSITLEGNGKDKCYEAFDVIPRAGYKDTDVKLSVIKPELLDYDQGTCNDIIIKVGPRQVFVCLFVHFHSEIILRTFPEPLDSNQLLFLSDPLCQ
jgi:hypothetical protein